MTERKRTAVPAPSDDPAYEWPTACADVRWREDGVGFRESAADAKIGDLIWQPKGGEGHLLVGHSEPFRYGWEDPWTVPVCECGGLDILDHHVFILARGVPS